MRRKIKICLVLLFAVTLISTAQSRYITETDIAYAADSPDEYRASRCLLDVYYPENGSGFKTVVWFHGGGLVEGNKFVPELLKGKGLCVVAVNYRLGPKAEPPAYIEDAAAAVAWTFRNIAGYGGDPQKIYVAGHSAGGYLTSMICFDDGYLSEYGLSADSVKGYFPISGQTVTHAQVLRSLGLPPEIPHIGRYSPIAHIRKQTPPVMFTAGQSDMEMNCRTVENRYMYEALKALGNDKVSFHEINGFDHGNVVEPALLLMLDAIGAGM